MDERLLWTNCGALWGRLFVLSAPLWNRSPTALVDARDALVAAIRYAGSADDIRAADLVARLEAFAVEDDGSPEWQYAVDLLGSLRHALSGEAPATTLAKAVTSYLDSTFTDLSNQLSEVAGGPISQIDAEKAAIRPPWLAGTRTDAGPAFRNDA
jgi:hypothetical protein